MTKQLYVMGLVFLFTLVACSGDASVEEAEESNETLTIG